jgi:isocitrate/isopropylmalate dehydrogenase
MTNHSDELDEIKKILSEHERRISNLENLVRSKPKKVEKHLSIKEFLLMKQPKKDVDKTLAIGYYLEHYKNISPFNAKDLENGFKEAREPPPKNINLTVIRNVEKGYIMEADEKKDNFKALGFNKYR